MEINSKEELINVLEEISTKLEALEESQKATDVDDEEHDDKEQQEVDEIDSLLESKEVD